MIEDVEDGVYELPGLDFSKSAKRVFDRIENEKGWCPFVKNVC